MGPRKDMRPWKQPTVRWPDGCPAQLSPRLSPRRSRRPWRASPPPSCGARPAPGGPCCAALRLAPVRSGGAARVALGTRVSPQGEGWPPAGTLGARCRGGGAKRAFILPIRWLCRHLRPFELSLLVTDTQLPCLISGHRAALGMDLFFFSCFNFRFSFGLSWAFFCCSFLPLSFFPLSPISVSPCLKMSRTGLWRRKPFFGHRD